MSRGLGEIQRRIVAKLTIYGQLDVKNIAQSVFFRPDKNRKEKFSLTRAQINSAHRAVKSLAKQGIIKASKEISDEGSSCWMLAKPVMDLEKIKRIAKRRKPSVVT